MTTGKEVERERARRVLAPGIQVLASYIRILGAAESVNGTFERRAVLVNVIAVERRVRPERGEDQAQALFVVERLFRDALKPPQLGYKFVFGRRRRRRPVLTELGGSRPGNIKRLGRYQLRQFERDGRPHAVAE